VFVVQGINQVRDRRCCVGTDCPQRLDQAMAINAAVQLELPDERGYGGAGRRPEMSDRLDGGLTEVGVIQPFDQVRKNQKNVPMFLEVPHHKIRLAALQLVRRGRLFDDQGNRPLRNVPQFAQRNDGVESRVDRFVIEQLQKGRHGPLGSNVSGFAPGELVSAEGHVVCAQCRNCLAGRRHLCQEPRGLGVNIPGAFAEYVVVPKTNVWRHLDGLDPEIGALFDPFGNAVHTALKFAVFGEDVLITGAGPIGLMATAVVAHAGARNIVVTDVHPFRLELAERMGATKAVDIRHTDLGQVQKELGMFEGFDVALEMSGSPAAMEDIIGNTIHGANIALLGIPADPYPIDWSVVIFNMLNIKGIYGREMYDTWYKMNVLIGSGLDIAPVITHRFAADDYDSAFEAIRSAESGKVLLRWAPD